MAEKLALSFPTEIINPLKLTYKYLTIEYEIRKFLLFGSYERNKNPLEYIGVFSCAHIFQPYSGVRDNNKVVFFFILNRMPDTLITQTFLIVI